MAKYNYIVVKQLFYKGESGFDIAMPTSLNSEEKELVAKLAQMPHFRNPEKSSKQNIFERMKDFFN